MEKDIYRAVKPGKGAAPYLGGKSRLAKHIINRIERVPHATYAEVFVGMGGIFFRRQFAPSQEVINDYGRDVFNFFRILQEHYVAFLDMMKFQITTRAEFERLKAVDPETLTDMKRAARFYYLQLTAFGGSPSHGSFGVSLGTPARMDITKLGSQLEEIHSRLSSVVIENLSFEEFIPRYDRPDTLFYLDPPYWDGENDYGKGLFEKSDFTLLADLLSKIQGRFILSINDVPEIREIFAGFDMEEVSLNYSISKGEATPAKELIISNGGEDPTARPGQAELL